MFYFDAAQVGDVQSVKILLDFIEILLKLAQKSPGIDTRSSTT